MKIFLSIVCMIMIAVACTQQPNIKLSNYSNQFFSFSYPENMSIDKATFETTHKINSIGKDTYGTGGIYLTTSDNQYSILIRTVPNWNGASSLSLMNQERQRLGQDGHQGDIISDALVDGQPAIRAFRPQFIEGNISRLGTEEAYIPDGKLIFLIQEAWDSAAGNNPHSPGREAFNQIIQSFRILSTQ